MMSVTGICGVAEVTNFLIDKVGKPWIMGCINLVSTHPNSRKAPHAIVLDIHAYNFPSGVQRVNNSGSSITDEAIFELKTYTACPL
jgi:hypothetical protein